MASVTIDCSCGGAFTVEIVGGQPATSMLCPRCGKDGMEAACKVIAKKSPAFMAASLPMAKSGGMGEPKPAATRSAPTAPVLGASAGSGAPPPLPSRPGRAPAAPPPPPPQRESAWPTLPTADAGHDEHAAYAERSAGVSEDGLQEGLQEEPVEHWSLSPEARERSEVEARAKILWGDPQEDVIKYLQELCFSEKQAAAMVADLYAERLAAVKAKGAKKMIVGVGLIVASGVGLFILNLIHMKSLWAIGSVIGVGVLGFWSLFDGSIKWFSPHLERGDVSTPE